MLFFFFSFFSFFLLVTSQFVLASLNLQQLFQPERRNQSFFLFLFFLFFFVCLGQYNTATVFSLATMDDGKCFEKKRETKKKKIKITQLFAMENRKIVILHEAIEAIGVEVKPPLSHSMCFGFF